MKNNTCLANIKQKLAPPLFSLASDERSMSERKARLDSDYLREEDGGDIRDALRLFISK